MNDTATWLIWLCSVNVAVVQMPSWVVFLFCFSKKDYKLKTGYKGSLANRDAWKPFAVQSHKRSDKKVINSNPVGIQENLGNWTVVLN